MAKVSAVNRDWEQRYRRKWGGWDKITRGAHCMDCYPNRCAFNVYQRDGRILYEEQLGTLPQIEKGVPDWNPGGCLGGMTYVDSVYGPQRVLYPLRRTGERGQGKWERVTWDEALTDIADAMLDAIEEVGPGAIVVDQGPANGGLISMSAADRFAMALGATHLDPHAGFNDFSSGLHETFGTMFFNSAADDLFHADTILVWNMNPAYSRQSQYHFVSEARYRGAHVVTISPDYNASSMHADQWIPVRIGSDAALALSLAQVIVSEGLVAEEFIREQTDMAFAVRVDNGRYLRASDFSKDSRDDQFYAVTGQGVSLVPVGFYAFPRARICAAPQWWTSTEPVSR